MKLPGGTVTGERYWESHHKVEEVLQLLGQMSPWERRLQIRRTGIPRHLYKYRSIPVASDIIERKRLELLLLENGLWLATPDTFNDPFDGKAAYEVKQRGAELREALERWHRRVAREGSQAARKWVNSEDVADPSRLERRYAETNNHLRKNIGVCSLSTDPANLLMWAHYASDHRGLCAQLRSANDPAMLLAHEMEYSGDYPVLSNMFDPPTERDAILPILRKSKDWEYEKEWRIVGLDEPNQIRTFHPQALSGVILGIRTTSEDRDYIGKLMQERERRYGCRPQVFQAVPGGRTYSIRMTMIDRGKGVQR
jgi:hypothetical protein